MPAGSARYEVLLASGRARLGEWRLDAALADFEAALRLRPGSAAAHYLRGEALFLQRRLDEALAAHADACRCGIDRDGSGEGGRGEAMSGVVPGDFAWMTHMLRGDFESAWRRADRDREQRQRAGVCSEGWPRHMRPVWNGRSLGGARVLVRCHHGLGDTVQFVRYVPRLAAGAAAVELEAQPELLPLLEGLPGVLRLHPLSAERDRPLQAFGCDAEIEVTELPHACRTTIETIPADIPYLRPPAGRAAEAARRLTRLGAGARLMAGLVWAAGDWKPERSLAPPRLAPLAEIPGLTLVNLQRGPACARWRSGPQRPAMAEVFDTDAVEDAAATIAGLDLVITVDTMVAHLAGALGVPVWLMLHFAADWRWLLDRADSPWYPTMRLFRQKRPGDWGPVVAAVAAALRQGVAEAAARRPLLSRLVS